MEAHVKFKLATLFTLVLLAGVMELAGVDGAGECGRTPVPTVALRMAPCVRASQDARVRVPAACCAAVQSLGRVPRCLCAVMLSDAARRAGVRPAIAVTIPKRCNLRNRPVGYKCGRYTLP